MRFEGWQTVLITSGLQIECAKKGIDLLLNSFAASCIWPCLKSLCEPWIELVFNRSGGITVLNGELNPFLRNVVYLAVLSLLVISQ